MFCVCVGIALLLGCGGVLCVSCYMCVSYYVCLCWYTHYMLLPNLHMHAHCLLVSTWGVEITNISYNVTQSYYHIHIEQTVNTNIRPWLHMNIHSYTTIHKKFIHYHGMPCVLHLHTMCVCIICAYVCFHLYVTFLHLDVLILIVHYDHTVHCSGVDRQMDGQTDHCAIICGNIPM